MGIRHSSVADGLRRHLRYGCRRLRASRAFTAAAVVTLALGMGGTTAIVTLMDSVMLRPLPVSDPGRLYRIGDGDDTTVTGRHGRWGVFSFPLYERLQAGAPEFEGITAFDWGGSLLSVRREGAEDAADQAPARGLRHGNVLLHARCRRLPAAGCSRRATTAPRRRRPSC